LVEIRGIKIQSAVWFSFSKLQALPAGEDLAWQEKGNG
jgi:hypothetical protein